VVLSRTLTLDTDALARLVRLENLGELHVTLKPLGLWRPKAEEHRVEAGFRAEFGRRGLVDGRGRLEPELAASLAVLCRAGVEFYGWMYEAETAIAVLAASLGREALLAIRHLDEVTLTQVRPEQLAELLVAQVPEVAPARGEAFNILRSDAVAAVAGRQRTEAGVGRRLASPEVRAVQHLAEQPAIGGGELHVAVRDRMARRRAVPYPLRYADTAGGRWLNYMTDADGGDHRVLVAPASPADLVRRLREMHGSLLG
jgi:hypothetical protein